MVIKRSISKKNYILALVFTSFIFIIAFLVGIVADRIFLEDVDQFNNEARFDLFRLELRSKLLGEHECTYNYGSPMGDEFLYITNEIMHLEESLGKNNPKVLKLKKYYSLLEIYDWMHYKDIKEKCGADYDLILYFYSNKEIGGVKECECDRQGFILGYVKEKNPNVRIYSFDYNLDLEEINILKEIYDVENVPTIIVNNNVLHGFSELEDIEYFI
tara:strand:- start:1100 stop:1747 length:648 start_codon:yes stop_codon:yes gene_type:complete